MLMTQQIFYETNPTSKKKEEKEATLRCCVSMLYKHILQLSDGIAYIKMSHRKIKATFKMFPSFKEKVSLFKKYKEWGK
jgi:hypothetical protein